MGRGRTLPSPRCHHSRQPSASSCRGTTRCDKSLPHNATPSHRLSTVLAQPYPPSTSTRHPCQIYSSSCVRVYSMHISYPDGKSSWLRASLISVTCSGPATRRSANVAVGLPPGPSYSHYCHTKRVIGRPRHVSPLQIRFPPRTPLASLQHP